MLDLWAWLIHLPNPRLPGHLFKSNRSLLMRIWKAFTLNKYPIC